MSREKGSFRKANMDIYQHELGGNNKDWLENYKHGTTEDGKTVFSSVVEGDGKHWVLPNILYQDGKLQEFGWEHVWDNTKYGIPFNKKEDAENFAQWLHVEHQTHIEQGLKEGLVKKIRNK